MDVSSGMDLLVLLPLLEKDKEKATNEFINKKKQNQAKKGGGHHST